MEKSKENEVIKEEEDEDEVPPLIQAISDCGVTGFDQLKSTALSPSNNCVFEIEASPMEDLSKPERVHALSISMPMEDHMSRNDDTLPHPIPVHKNVSDDKNKAKFYSQPIPRGASVLSDPIFGNKSPNIPPKNPAVQKLKDRRFDSFKTWSGKLERPISQFRGKRSENELELQPARLGEMESMPVDRYFDALKGPELETLRDSEEILLPEDKRWPFLLRFPVSSFGICLGVSSQAIMWKALASSNGTKFLHMTPKVNLILWLISSALMAIVTLIYALKIIFYFEAVRREYYHPIRVNFFFAPWITLLFLFLGIPSSVAHTLHKSFWYILMAPIVCLELKIYGQWMSGGQRRLSKVANPSNHLSVVGNFVGALLGASMGIKEWPIFFFAIGLAHYIVVFVTLYQRLPTNETLPKELHPVFFLFVAAPSVASMAWAKIVGSFDIGSRISYFIALFLYFSLAVRLNFFRGFRFSLAWWAYTFPMTGAAIATISYSSVVTNIWTKCLTVFLCVIATITVGGLLVITLLHAFVLNDLFPNDIAIAISERRPKTTHHHRWYHRRTGSTETTIDQFLQYATSDDKDVEASLDPPSSNKQETDRSSSKARDA